MLQIRTACTKEFARVQNFYYELIDAMQEAPYSPGWKKDIYPTREYLADAIALDTLYIGEEEEKIAACMIVNHAYNPKYNDVSWQVDAADTELLIIHTLGVLPAFSGRGIAKKMVEKALDIARAQGKRAVRLDVLKGNLPAERLYTGMGFTYLETLQMYYEDTGWTDYQAFEYLIRPRK